MGYFFQETNSANKSLSNLDAQGNAKFADKQDKLVSGDNIKTINNISLLGSGDIQVGEGGTIVVDQSYDAASTYAQAGTAVAQAIATRASTALDNLSSDGQMIIDSANGTISNCILEIPQNLKLTLENNVLTLKSGSVLTLTGSTYTTATTTSDFTLTISSGFSDGIYMIFSTTSGFHQPRLLSNVTSGSTFPTENLSNLSVFYNTTDKKLYKYLPDTSTWTEYTNIYPNCLIQMTSGVASFAKDSNGNDMIFNGACFVGHHAVIYPNVKGLGGDGITSVDTLNSRSLTNTSVTIIELTTNGNSCFLYQNLVIGPRTYLGEFDSISDINTTGRTGLRLAYLKSKNYIIWNNTGSTWIPQIGGNTHCLILQYSYSNGVVTDFTIRQPVRTATVEMLDKKQDNITAITGYDATKTQTLKNVSGTLTWVDD